MAKLLLLLAASGLATVAEYPREAPSGAHGPLEGHGAPPMRASAEGGLLGMRLRGGGRNIGRRTQPSKVPEEFHSKRYDPTWHPLKVRQKVFTGLDEDDPYTEQAEPGNPWSVGVRSRNLAPEGMRLGIEIPWEYAGIIDGQLLYHPDTMEPLNLDRMAINHEKDEWAESRIHDDEMTPQVWERMERAREWHPLIREIADRFEEGARERRRQARVAAEGIGCPPGGKAGARRRGTGGESEGMWRALGEAGAKSRESGGVERVLVPAGQHNLSSLNGLCCLAVGSGAALQVEGAGGEARGGERAELLGCAWLDEGSKGSLGGLRVCQGDGNRIAGEEDGELGEPLPALTVLGAPWEISDCELRGGWHEVLGMRGWGDAALVRCVVGAAPPPEGGEPEYTVEDPIYNRTLPVWGMPRMVQGALLFDDSRLRMDRCLFDHSLFGGLRLTDSSVAVVDGTSFCNDHVGIELLDGARASLSACRFQHGGCAVLAHGGAQCLAEGCLVNRTRLGVALHNASSLALRGCEFIECPLGALCSGHEPQRQRLEVSNCTIRCRPDPVTHGGYAWHPNVEAGGDPARPTPQRPRGLFVDEGNLVIGDPYYPGGFDFEGHYAMPFEDLNDWVEAQHERIVPGYEAETRSARQRDKELLNVGDLERQERLFERAREAERRREEREARADAEHGPVDQPVWEEM